MEKNSDKNQHSYIARIKDFMIDADYSAWLSDIKRRYLSAQIKSAIKVNVEKLQFNWSIGRDLVIRKAEEHWGAGVVEQLSFDLQEAFPNDRGFSSRNVWRMKQWYLFFSTPEAQEKLPQLGAELQDAVSQSLIKLPQAGAEIREGEMPYILGLVPWRHQTEILSRCKTLDEVLFYFKQCILHGWSRQTLTNSLKADLFSKQGNAITNFPQYLPETQSKLAQEITKDNYDFSFITLPNDYKERHLEAALDHNITRFLLELGTGFAFVGRQVEVVVNGRSRSIDMLFYHIRLKAYIVVELKVTPFEPEYAGKLNYYVSAVDELMKRDDDNPTIGLLICSDKDETDVRWAFRGVQTPMGVASYDSVNVVSEPNLLPSVEELQARVRQIEQSVLKSVE